MRFENRLSLLYIRTDEEFAIAWDILIVPKMCVKTIYEQCLGRETEEAKRLLHGLHREHAKNRLIHIYYQSMNFVMFYNKVRILILKCNVVADARDRGIGDGEIISSDSE